MVNRSGNWSNDNVFVQVVGTNLDTNQQGHVDAGGTFVPAAVGQSGFGLPLSERATVPLPSLSGRIYLSLEQPLPFSVVDTPNGPGMAHPAGWVDSDPSLGILFDFFEFTNNASGMYCNSTAVDMFSLPMAITLRGSRQQTAGTIAAGGRTAIFDDVRNADGHGALVVGDRRIIAPSHGTESGRFDTGYFDDYVGRVWDKYAGTDLNVTAGTASYRLRVEGGAFNAYSGGTKVASFNRPSTQDVLFCNGALSAPNDGVSGPIAAILAAGINRTTLLDQPNQPSTDASTFYQQPRTHHYAKALHAHHTDGKVYGFAFDDVAGFASYIEDGAPTAVELSLDAF